MYICIQLPLAGFRKIASTSVGRGKFSARITLSMQVEISKSYVAKAILQTYILKVQYRDHERPGSGECLGGSMG